MFDTSYSPVFHPAMAFAKIYSDCDKIWVKATFFHKIRFIIWMKTITLDLWKNTPKCVWKPHVILQDLLKTLIENVILQDLPQNLDENNKILFVSQDLPQSCFEDTKNVAFQDLLSKLERNVFSQDLLWYIGVWEQLCKERKGQKSLSINFANYLEDFCHRLKLKTSLKRGWIFICLAPVPVSGT